MNDQSARLQAIDVSSSYIVQAPAGSGKTEILTQRYLALLAQVEKTPEQILAITFTRKASVEMRDRIISWLIKAKNNTQTINAHEKKTLELARKVLIRDEEESWSLLDNPNRMSIQTIDALSSNIAHKLPLLSRINGSTVIDNAVVYYQQASQSLLSMIDSQDFLKNPLTKILLHLDNRYEKVSELFISMLSKRDQWLPYCLNNKPDELKAHLQNNLNVINTETISEFVAAITDYDVDGFLRTIKFVVENLVEGEFRSNLSLLEIIDVFDVENVNTQIFWKACVKLFLTGTGDFRKTLTLKQGFPAKSKATNADEKERFVENKEFMMTWIESLENNLLLSNLVQQINLLPPSLYTDSQWSILESLLKVLPLLAAELKLVFKQNRVVDFIEISCAALEALGHDEMPSELALAMDYKLQHILVDEFQDTSLTQWQLLEKLIAGWQQNDGRTLFLVGDPMQSIYRFRQAEVGLFIKAKNEGIGQLQLQALTLSANFRQAINLVDWNNNYLKHLFPHVDHIANGAITYSPAQAVQAQEGAGLTAFSYLSSDPVSENKKVIEIIKAEKNQNSEASIAVLVRSRSHLQSLIPALSEHGIAYQAVDLEPLANKQHVIDCLSLTRALMHHADRAAWLSVLRAPWCGLPLSDLLIISKDRSRLIWQIINDRSVVAFLSPASGQRLQQFVMRINNQILSFGKRALAQRFYSAWQSIGGPACLKTDSEYFDIKKYHNALQEEEQLSAFFSVDQLTKKLNVIFSETKQADKLAVQVMTIHKAKGLEFDVVILPGLGKRMPYDDHQLLSWSHFACYSQAELLWLLAPIANTLTEENKIYDFIRSHHQIKSAYELIRVLYVALTRAKYKTYLLGGVKLNKKQEHVAEKGSFYHILLSLLGKNVEFLSAECINKQNNAQAYNRALPATWQHPFQQAISQLEEKSNNTTDNSSYCWQENNQKQDGIIIHRLLQYFAENRICSISHESLASKVQLLMKHYGYYGSNFSARVQTITKVLYQALNCQYGKWLLQNHADSACELELTAVINGNNLTCRIDRSFVADDYRWIIDYKYINHLQVDEQFFLEKQKNKFAKQMLSYAQVFSKLESRPIKLGIYFPGHDVFISWDAALSNNLMVS